MKNFLKHIIAYPPIYRFTLRFFCKIDTKVYAILSRLAVLGNHDVHPKHDILKYHDFFKSHVTHDDHVVDIGCGKGENAYAVAQVAKEVVGIDIDASSIEVAKNKYVRDNVKFMLGDVTTHEFGKKFDKIILSNVLEHIEDRISFLKKLHEVSDVILIRVPMITRDWLPVFKKNKGMEYRLDPTHFTEYTVEQMKEETLASNWEIKEYSVQFGEFWGVLSARSEKK